MEKKQNIIGLNGINFDVKQRKEFFDGLQRYGEDFEEIYNYMKEKKCVKSVKEVKEFYILSLEQIRCVLEAWYIKVKNKSRNKE